MKTHDDLRERAPCRAMMRDAKVTQIFEGTNQIQRQVIARHPLK